VKRKPSMKPAETGGKFGTHFCWILSWIIFRL
jgi:hypothetical protein